MTFWRSRTRAAPAAAAPAPERCATRAAAPLALANAAIGRACHVIAVNAPAAAPDWGRWLAEIGFTPGESAMVTARSPWGDGALVVRIGSSNFALRRDEASCVEVRAL